MADSAPDSIAQIMIARLSDPAYRAHVASFDARDYAAELDRYGGRLAFIGGMSDRLVPPAAIEASAAAHRAVVRWMASCGHYPHHEARDQFVDALAELTLSFLV